MSFQRAVKTQSRLRLALIGPAGAGKTYTALTIAAELGEKIAVVDTEHGSAAKYADLFTFDTPDKPLPDHSPETYVAQIRAAADAGYDVLVIDSLTHEWKWCLEEVDNVKARTKNPNSYAAWKDITPRHAGMIEAILQAPIHVIATMRTKMDYVLEDIDGKKVPRKIGMAPVQRDGVEYEFDLIGDMDMDNTLIVTKTRCSALTGKVIRKPGKELAESLKTWLGSGAEPVPAPSPALGEKSGGEGASDAAECDAIVEQLTGMFGGRLTPEQSQAIQKNRHKVEWLRAALAQAALAKEAEDKGQSQFVIPASAKGK